MIVNEQSNFEFSFFLLYINCVDHRLNIKVYIILPSRNANFTSITDSHTCRTVSFRREKFVDFPSSEALKLRIKAIEASGLLTLLVDSLRPWP